MAEPQNPSNNIIMKDDILLCNILPRLPVKPVGRFRCVSRQWHSFLTSPVFAKMQLHHVTNDYRQNHHKLLLLSTTPTSMFRTLDCETPTNGLTASRPFPFEVRPGTLMSIVASLHGMVCIRRTRFVNQAPYNDLLLWNPLTSDYKTLSEPSPDEDGFYATYRGQFGLYNSSWDNDYKLLCVTSHPNDYIYSLKSDSWRKVESTKTTSMGVTNFHTIGVLLDEKLHFLIENEIYGEYPSYIIRRFDTKTEKLKELATPTFKERTECMGFLDLRGSIGLSVAFRYSTGECHKIELWRMNGDGDWTKLATYLPIEWYYSHVKLLHIMRNGVNWLIYCDGYLLREDMKKHTVVIMCSFKSMNIDQGWKYMETVVSPNQHMK